MNRLDNIVNYAECKDCLRKYILEYFGEKVTKQRCENCSSCCGNIELNLTNRPNKKVPAVIHHDVKQTTVIDSDNGLLDELRQLRTEIAKERRVPPYFILHDKTLLDIVNVMPTNDEEFITCDGIGEFKAKKYGERIYPIVRRYKSDGFSQQKESTPIEITPILDGTLTSDECVPISIIANRMNNYFGKKCVSGKDLNKYLVRIG
jgi:superfamily II DNA helicase RecQ